MYAYLEAISAKDEEKVKKLQEKFSKSQVERKKLDYKWLSEHLDPGVFEVFTEIDKKYDRHIGWTNTGQIMGNWYRNTLFYSDCWGGYVWSF